MYHKKLDDEWRSREQEALRDALRAQNLDVDLIRQATKTKIELDQDYIDEHLPVAGKEMIYSSVRTGFYPAERGDEYSDAGMGAGRNQRLKRRFTGAVLRQR